MRPSFLGAITLAGINFIARTFRLISSRRPQRQIVAQQLHNERRFFVRVFVGIVERRKGFFERLKNLIVGDKSDIETVPSLCIPPIFVYSRKTPLQQSTNPLTS